MAIQLATNFPAIQETRKFIAVFTTARYLSVSSTRLTQPTPSNIPTRSILISSSNLRIHIPYTFELRDVESTLRGKAIQLATNFPVIHETRKFMALFTTARYLSVSSTRLTQPTPSNIPIRSILILSSNLRIHIPSGLFHTTFPSYAVLSLPFVPHAPVISSSLMELE